MAPASSGLFRVEPQHDSQCWLGGGLLSLTGSLLTPAKLLCMTTPPSSGLTEFCLQNGVDFWP